MAQLQSTSVNGNLVASGILEGSTIKKTGGTGSQFLKADGTVDSSAYITSASLGSMAYQSTSSYYTTSNSIYTNAGSFTTAGTGWYRVATTGSDGRGTYYVEVYTTGGNHNPSYLKILAHGDWGNDKLVTIETDGGFPASAVRITRGASNTFLEVYFTTTILGASLRVNRLGFDSSVQIYTGALPSGGDTLKDQLPVDSKFITQSISATSRIYVGNGGETLGLIGMGASNLYGLGISGAYTSLYGHFQGNGVQLGYYNGSSFTPRLIVNNGGDIVLTSGTSGTTGKLIFKTTDNSDLNKYIMQDGYWTVIGTHSNEGLRVRDSGGNILINIAGSTNGYPSRVGIGTTTPSYKLHIAGDVYADGGWMRISGTAGLYWETYGGGFRMTGSSYVEMYNNKSLHMQYGSVDYVGSMYLESGGQGVHLQPNTSGSYGALQITSSRNGWPGIYFTVAGTSLMVNSNESGFYRQGYGWQMRWENGTGYVHKNGQGGGTSATILDTSNYTTWAQPKVYMGQSDGNWQNFTNDVGEFRVDEVLNITSGAHSNYPPNVYTYGGVLSWRLANHSFQLYASHTGDITFKTQWGNDNYSGWRRILHESNYNSWVPTLTGGGASGTWGINITGNAATTSQTNFSSLTVNSNTVLHAGNYTSYTLPIGGGWYGSGLPGSRWNGLSVNGGEIVFGNGLPNANQMGILVDGCYVAGENNGFWSMDGTNTWGSRRGMYWDGSYLNFTTNTPTARFQAIYTDGSITGADIYTNSGWFRNHTNNNGIYWSNTGWHIYPADSANMRMRADSSSTVALRMETSSGNVRGYVYANNSNEIGFLNSAGSWSLRCDNSGNVYTTGQLNSTGGSFYVGGSVGTFYPVLIGGTGWFPGPATPFEFEIFRADVHADATWRGTFNMKFKLRYSNCGHASTSIYQIEYRTGGGDYGGSFWGDIATVGGCNGSNEFVIWLRGGTTYYFRGDTTNSMYLRNANSSGTSVTDASGTTRNTISSEQTIPLLAKNKVYFYDLNPISSTYYIGNNDTYLQQGGGNALRVITPSGYLDAGPMNSGYCHFQTDRSQFYFNRSVYIDGPAYRYGGSRFVEETGTWGINVTGSAGSLSNMNISQFTNNSGYITSVSNLAIQAIGGDSGAFNLDGISSQHAFVRFSTGAWTGTNPYAGNYSHVISINQSTGNGNRTVQMYMGDVPGAIWWRMNQGGTQHPWERILTSNNASPAWNMNQNVRTTDNPTFNILTLTSYLTVGSGLNSSDIYMSDGDEGTRRIHCNSNRIGFLTQSANWGAYCDDDGNWTAVGDITAYSDARVKENVKTVENALDKTLKMRGVTFTRNDIEDKSTRVGVIAQEVMEVLPEVVKKADDGMYNVSYGNIVGVLIEAIKEQQKQIDDLKSQINGTSK